MTQLSHPPSSQFTSPLERATSARVVGAKGFWSVYLRDAEGEWPLVLGQTMRVFRHFESVVVQLKNRGIHQFQVDIQQEQAADKEVVISPMRPKILKRVYSAEAYDGWFRDQVHRSLDGAQTLLSDKEARALMAEFKHSNLEVTA
ncbi:MAG TPA: hypothetical protein PK129_11750 [Cellvibrionaceae bacterium]|nr:hypothetical protein [Cellvibrionaceae bacterium]